MIIAGKNGSLVLFWNEELMSSLPLGKFSYDGYIKEAEKFIVSSMKEDKKNIKELIHYCKYYCDLEYRRKKEGKRRNSKDHCYFQLSLLSLVRLGLLEFDEVCLIAPRKKPRKSREAIKAI